MPVGDAQLARSGRCGRSRPAPSTPTIASMSRAATASKYARATFPGPGLREAFAAAGVCGDFLRRDVRFPGAGSAGL